MSKRKMDAVTIYLVDTGIDNTHHCFSNTNIVNLYTYNETFTDTDGHGTGVASIIVNTVSNVILKNVKIAFGTDSTFGQLWEAFNTILRDDASDVRIINCSWAWERHHLIDDKIKEFDPKKFIVIAAAGNELQPAKNYSPVNIDAVLGVGACDKMYRMLPWKENRGSNWGPEVNITARGVDVEVATLEGGTALASGTSLAAATVSGIAAQFIQNYPEKNALEIKEMILQSAVSNLLIRDDAVYGTTPNLLVRKVSYV